MSQKKRGFHFDVSDKRSSVQDFDAYFVIVCMSQKGECFSCKSSVCVRLAHLVYLTITYQLVKLFGAALKKAGRNRLENRYMKCGIFGIVTSRRLVCW